MNERIELRHPRFRHADLGIDALLARADPDARRILHVAGRIAELRHARERELVARARLLAPDRLGVPELRTSRDPVLRMAQHRPSDALSVGDLSNALFLHFADAAPALPAGAARDAEGWDRALRDASEAWSTCSGADEGPDRRIARPWSYRWAAFLDAAEPASIDVPVLLSSLDDRHLFTFARTQDHADGLVTMGELLAGMRAHLADGGARRLVPTEVNDIEATIADPRPLASWALAWPRYEVLFRTPIRLATHLGAGAAALSFEPDRLDAPKAESTLRALLGLSPSDTRLAPESEPPVEPLPLAGARHAKWFVDAARALARGRSDKGQAELVGRELFMALAEHDER